MKAFAQMTQRIKCYALSDATSGTQFTSPRYLYQGTVWGWLDTRSGSQPYAAVVAGQIVDATLLVRQSAPVTQDGVIAVKGAYYTILAVVPLDTQGRYQCPCRHVERAKIATDDAPVSTITLTPAAVTVAHGTPDALAASTISLADIIGYALANRYCTITRVGGTSTLTAAVRGSLIDLHAIPNAPATGDEFLVACEDGTPAFLTVTVS